MKSAVFECNHVVKSLKFGVRLKSTSTFVQTSDNWPCEPFVPNFIIERVILYPESSALAKATLTHSLSNN